MAITYAAITGQLTRISDGTGVAARINVEPLVTDALISLDGEGVKWGIASKPTDSAGNLPAAGPTALRVPLTDDDPPILWKVTAEPLNPLDRGQVGITPAQGGLRTSVLYVGPITADVTLDFLASTGIAAILATFPPQVVAQVMAALAAAEAAADAAESVGTTNDTVIAGRINDPASATRAALAASYAHLDEDDVLVIDGVPVGGSGGGATFPDGADGQVLTKDSTKPEGVTFANSAGGLRHLERMFPCATGANDLNMSSSDGAQPRSLARTLHQILYPVTEIRLVYGRGGHGDGYFPDPTIVTEVRAGVENAFGIITPVTFGGSLVGSFTEGGWTVSDPISLNAPYGGNATDFAGAFFDYFWVRTYAKAVGATAQVSSTLVSERAGLAGEGAEYGATLTDKSLSGTITPGMPNNNSTRPCMIIGTPAIGARPIVFGWGDSIVFGAGDTPSGYAPKGYFGRAFYGAGLPFIRWGLPAAPIPDMRAASGTTPPTWGSGPFRSSPRYWVGSTHVVTEFGINNWVAAPGGSADEVGFKLLNYWRWIALHGARVWQTTITPFTSSTDGWATVGNQTVASYEAARAALNTWLRDGAPVNPSNVAVAVGTSGATRCPVYDSAGAKVADASGPTIHPLQGGVIEISDVVESARNSGKWKANYTADGVHPNEAAHTAAAVAMPVAQFT